MGIFVLVTGDFQLILKMEKSKECQEHFYDLVSKFSDAMLVSHTLNCKFHARPMKIVKVEKDSGIYFITSVNAPKVDELKTNDMVLLTMQSGSMFLTLNGCAQVCQDRAKLASLWSEGFRPYFPAGPDAPDLCLLKVVPQTGEYWDNSGIVNKLSFAFELGRAYLTGEKANVHDHTTSGKVALAAQ